MNAFIRNSVDLYPATYSRDDLIMSSRDMVADAWLEFDLDWMNVSMFLDMLAPRADAWSVGDFAQIEWRIGRVSIRMFQAYDKISRLHATFHRKSPGQEPARTIASLATSFRLCAVTERGVIRASTLETFADTVLSHYF